MSTKEIVKQPKVRKPRAKKEDKVVEKETVVKEEKPKPKRVMSDKQKQALKEGREKALKAKMANK